MDYLGLEWNTDNDIDDLTLSQVCTQFLNFYLGKNRTFMKMQSVTLGTSPKPLTSKISFGLVKVQDISMCTSPNVQRQNTVN